MLVVSAITTANTDAHTEVAPLIPNSQGISAGDRPDASRMPSGKAIPMNNPSGKRTPTATAMRRPVTLAWN